MRAGAEFAGLVELVCFTALALALIKAVKFEDKPWAVSKKLSRSDFISIVIVSALASSLSSFGVPALTFVALFLAVSVLLALCFDAIMFAAFTIELGPGGVGGVVLSLLIKELTKLEYVRAFFRTHRWFLCLPFAIVASFSTCVVSGGARTVLGIFAALYFAIAIGRFMSRPLIWVLWLGAIASLGVQASVVQVEREYVMFALGVACVLVVVLLRERDLGTIIHFFRARPLPDPNSIEVRAEHRALVDRLPRYEPSARFGALSKADIVLVTCESIGRDHLDEAGTPFLASLAKRSLVSRNHFAISPTTNNAHLALYFSRYLDSGQDVPVADWTRRPEVAGAIEGFKASPAILRAHGYTTVYLSTAETAYYGLGDLIRGAGFEHVIDAAQLGADPTDYTLIEEGLAKAETLRTPGPLFLHVHLANTHVPYRVVDGRFAKRAGDRGRFLDAIEETDHILSRLFAKLRENTLFVLSGDHGQAFGEQGYLSHGSAVIKEELMVPFLLHHAALGAGEVRYSNHFDVLPTILDLAGIEGAETLGASLYLERESDLFVWAGHPSRTTTSNFGLILGNRKIMLDLVADECRNTNWNDADPSPVSDADRTYYATLIAKLMNKHRLR